MDSFSDLQRHTCNQSSCLSGVIPYITAMHNRTVFAQVYCICPISCITTLYDTVMQLISKYSKRQHFDPPMQSTLKHKYNNFIPTLVLVLSCQYWSFHIVVAILTTADQYGMVKKSPDICSCPVSFHIHGIVY